MSGQKRDHVWSELADFSGMATYLRRRFPHKTAFAVSEATGLPADSVKKWLNLETQPSGGAMLTLWFVFGDDLLLAASRRRPHWMADPHMARIEKLKSELAALERR